MRPSEYAQLKRENDRREGALPLADREEIGRAMASIRRASWNLYELERLRKDLIDMALRAALEHKTLAESLGPGRQEIYDDMAVRSTPAALPTGSAVWRGRIRCGMPYFCLSIWCWGPAGQRLCFWF